MRYKNGMEQWWKELASREGETNHWAVTGLEALKRGHGIFDFDF